MTLVTDYKELLEFFFSNYIYFKSSCTWQQIQIVRVERILHWLKRKHIRAWRSRKDRKDSHLVNFQLKEKCLQSFPLTIKGALLKQFKDERNQTSLGKNLFLVAETLHGRLTAELCKKFCSNARGKNPRPKFQLQLDSVKSFNRQWPV